MNVQEHEQKIRQLNERCISGIATREEIQAEISRLLCEDNLAFRLQERLVQQINEKISSKLKERLSEREYFLKRDELENQIIQGGFPYAFFQESTLEEIENLNIDVLDKKTLMLIVIQALKSYIDNGLENDPKAVLLHKLYLQLKEELRSILPFQSNCEDGFTEYLASKSERTEYENARQTGSVCLKCGSHNVRSKGAEWVCLDCNKRFRKH